MCGICGIYHLDGRPADAGLLARMTAVMEHRGPDGSGTFVSGSLGLGHRRLSIIDIDGGAQPMRNESGDIVIVFNGEIYNYIELRRELENRGHRFRTASDTEVIIHGYEEWGRGCVSRFNGMFAFALWDCRTRSLLLVRDHLGVKPLYYVVLGKKLLFASEIKALLQDPECPREVDTASLGDLFTYRYVPSPRTLFSGINKLPPGHWMVCDANGVRHVTRYWVRRPRHVPVRKEEDLVEQYRELVEDAIRLQLRSDVPVGVFLSSGVDSNAILAVMAKHATAPVHTFTIGFEDGERTNETGDARVMANRFGADHAEMIVTAADYEKYYDTYLWNLEEPVGNESAAAFYFVSRIASEKVKVALTGQGADEPWGGYHRHLGAKLSALYSMFPRAITGTLERIVPLLPRNERLKRGIASLSEQDMLKRFVKIYSFYTPEMKERLFQGWLKEDIRRIRHDWGGAISSLQADVTSFDPLTQILYMDTRSNLPDDLLMVSDKTSMANSIESRVPFLDYRLVEMIETLPPHLKIRGLQGKYLHKKAMERWLPREVVYRKKKGFAHPVDKWLRGRMRQCVDDCLLSETSSISRYFNKEFVRHLVDAHGQRRQDYMRHLYLLISFELWHRKFIGG